MLVEMASEKYSNSKPLPFGRMKTPMYVHAGFINAKIRCNIFLIIACWF